MMLKEIKKHSLLLNDFLYFSTKLLAIIYIVAELVVLL